MVIIKRVEEVLERLDRNIGTTLQSRLFSKLIGKYNPNKNCDTDDSQKYLNLSLLQFLDDDIKELKLIWKELKEKSRVIKNLTKIKNEDISQSLTGFTDEDVKRISN